MALSTDLSCCDEHDCFGPAGSGREDCYCPWWWKPCVCFLCRMRLEERDATPTSIRDWALAQRPSPNVRLRGIETDTGEAGWCPRCRRDVPEGPDLCLGQLQGVSYACCGHTPPELEARYAYVVLGGDPERAFIHTPDAVALHEEGAIAWFDAHGVGPNHLDRLAATEKRARSQDGDLTG